MLSAKTTYGPNPTYVLSSGDAAHQQALYHILPPPLQLNTETFGFSPAKYDHLYSAEIDRCATPDYFDRTSTEAITDRAILIGKVSCTQTFPDKAIRTLAALCCMKAYSDVMVVLLVFSPSDQLALSTQITDPVSPYRPPNIRKIAPTRPTLSKRLI